MITVERTQEGARVAGPGWTRRLPQEDAAALHHLLAGWCEGQCDCQAYGYESGLEAPRKPVGH